MSLNIHSFKWSIWQQLTSSWISRDGSIILICMGTRVTGSNVRKPRFWKLYWKWKKEMFYLTMNSTHFNLRLYGVRYIIKDHSDSERNPAANTMWATLFQLAARILLHATSHRQDSTNHGFVMPVMEHWLGRAIAQWVHQEGTVWRPIAPWANTLTMELHLAPQVKKEFYIT